MHSREMVNAICAKSYHVMPPLVGTWYPLGGQAGRCTHTHRTRCPAPTTCCARSPAARAPCLSPGPGQVLLAQALGAEYAAPYLGRMNDAYGNNKVRVRVGGGG